MHRGWDLSQIANQLSIMTIDACCQKLLGLCQPPYQLHAQLALCLYPKPFYQQSVRQFIDILNGISKEDSKKITNLVKSSKAKVQASINGDEVRITGKKRDDLQSMIELLKSSDIKIPLQFQNFRD